MQNSLQFSEEKLRQKFDQIADETDNKVDLNQFRQLLAHIQLAQPYATGKKLVEGFYHFAEAKTPLSPLKSFSNAKSLAEKPKQQQNNQQSQDDEDYDEQNQQQEKDPQSYRLNYQQVLKGAILLTNKIKYQIWKSTSRLYSLQNELVGLSKRAYFPIKDPGHLAKINILVGEEVPHYNSYLRVRASKKVRKVAANKRENEFKIGLSSQNKEVEKTQAPVVQIQQHIIKQKAEKANSKATSFAKQQQEQVLIVITFITSRMDQSVFLSQIWKKIHEFVTSMVEGEFTDGKSFMSSILISTDIQERHFQIKVACHNPQINQLLYAGTNFFDSIFKTQVKFGLQFLFQFGFDLKNLIENSKASIYDFLTKNVRIKLNYQGSQYVTALKELMIFCDAFEGLRYVSDDETSLMLIALISSHVLQLNLRFKNAEHEVAEQQTLKQLFTMIQEELRPMLQKLKQQSPQMYDLIINALNKAVRLEANIYDITVKAEAYIQNIDKLLIQGQLNGDQDNSEAANSANNEKEQQKEQQPNEPENSVSDDND